MDGGLTKMELRNLDNSGVSSTGNPTERRNQEVKKGLRLRLTAGYQRILDERLPELLFGLRRRRGAATAYTSSYLLMEREIL